MSLQVEPVGLVGQAIVDVMLPQHGLPYRMRLGGVLHAARALWAAGRPYTLAFASPDYLTAQVEAYARAHGAVATSHFATVQGSPNVMLIGESKEIGDQAYEDLLRDEYKCHVNPEVVRRFFADIPVSKILLISGGYDITAILNFAREARSQIHLDLSAASADWDAIKSSGLVFDAVSLSTSSPIFRERFKSSSKVYWEEVLPRNALVALLKENRGGSRLQIAGASSPISTPAFLGDTIHSVGVGDCFDAIWAILRVSLPDNEALAYASLVAADYAATTDPDVFRQYASASLSLPSSEAVEAAGVLLPWETRAEVNVYVAAPDFDFANREPIDRVADALRYHNFVPRLPVRENGQMGVDASLTRKAALLQADLQLLEECQMMVAVLTYMDPGTLIEIGIACERGMPVIVLNLAGLEENLMLTQLPTLVTSDLEYMVTAVYEQAALLTRST